MPMLPMLMNYGRSVYLLLLICAAMNTAAQDQMIGVRAGPNIFNITDPQFPGSEPRTGFSAGLTYDRPVLGNFLLSMGLVYEQRGFRSPVIFTNELGEPTGRVEFTDFSYDYLTIPFRIGHMISGRFHAFGNVGLVPAILINATTTLPIINVQGDLEGTQTVSVISEASTIDLAGMVEVGGGVRVHERILLSVSGSYQHSFLSVTNVGYFSNSRISPFGITLSGGLRYILHRPSAPTTTP